MCHDQLRQQNVCLPQPLPKVILNFCSVSKAHQQFAQIAVDAVMSVADLQRKDVLFDLIKVDGKVGGQLADRLLLFGEREVHVTQPAGTGAAQGFH